MYCMIYGTGRAADPPTVTQRTIHPYIMKVTETQRWMTKIIKLHTSSKVKFPSILHVHGSLKFNTQWPEEGVTELIGDRDPDYALDRYAVVVKRKRYRWILAFKSYKSVFAIPWIGLYRNWASLRLCKKKLY